PDRGLPRRGIRSSRGDRRHRSRRRRDAGAGPESGSGPGEGNDLHREAHQRRGGVRDGPGHPIGRAGSPSVDNHGAGRGDLQGVPGGRTGGQGRYRSWVRDAAGGCPRAGRPGVAPRRGVGGPAGGRRRLQREARPQVAGPLTLPQRVTIREVGPRDGLQAEKPLAVEARARLIDALSATGVPKIEAVSFVSPTAVPAMADPGEVWKRVRRKEGVEYSALVPNRRGGAAAVEAGGFASFQAFLAASDGYNRKT